MPSHVIALANQKGGVGKTTTAVNLGASLAAAEQRTLVIDMDPQGNASSGFGLTRRRRSVTLYDVLSGSRSIGAVISRAVYKDELSSYLDVIPANEDLFGAETELADSKDRHVHLREALRDVRHLYDFVLIDCPPSMGVLTLNALSAADTVLIPVQAEYFALDGLAYFAQFIEWVQEHFNRDLGVEGVLLTLYDNRLRLAEEVASETESYLGAHTLRTRIPRNVRLAEAPSFGQPALLYDVSSPGAQAYLALAKEIMARAPLMFVDGHRVPRGWSSGVS